MSSKLRYRRLVAEMFRAMLGRRIACCDQAGLVCHEAAISQAILKVQGGKLPRVCPADRREAALYELHW